MKKRLAALVMAIVMSVSLLSGCGGTSNGGGKDASSGSGERMTLQLWTTNRTAAENNNAWYITKIEDTFHVNIELKARNEGGSDYTDWLTLTLASGDAPDWFRDQSVSAKMLNDFVSQDLVAKLDPKMVEEAMPNYMKWTKKYNDIFGDDPFNLYAIDGSIYTLYRMPKSTFPHSAIWDIGRTGSIS